MTTTSPSPRIQTPTSIQTNSHPNPGSHNPHNALNPPVEALVGTLRAARKQGKVAYDGEMLFQGVHDEVVISIVEA
jgi:hypothetical protein